MKKLGIVLFLLFSFPAWAQYQAPLAKGVAMHGLPRYGWNFKNFDYVNPDAPKGGTLKMSAFGSFDTFNPYVIKGVAAAGTGLLFDTLMVESADEPFSEYGLIAETIEMPQDRSWVAFNINRKARFSDGTPVTAQDVVFSFNLLKTKGLPMFRYYYGNVEDVTADKPMRVLFTFKKGDNRELPLILGQMPVLSEQYWKDKDFTATTLDKIVGSGPYKISDFEAIELADSMGFAAEEEAKKGNDDKAMDLLNEAIEITRKYEDCKDALAYALMNRAKYNQSRNPEPPEGFLEDMDTIIPALEAMPIKDKRTRENIAQAYMFRSMVRDPNDYDNLLKDLEGSYEALLSLAQEGDVNEMFFMSSAHSYLVLLNMKDHEKARKVREQLMEMGISQKDLDRSTRGTIGNVSSKKTKVDLLSSQQSKPIPGRRLKRQIKHKN